MKATATDKIAVMQGKTLAFPLAVRLLPLLVLLLSFSRPVLAQSFNPLISFSVESCTLDAALEKLFADYELNVAFSKSELSKIRIEGYSCSYKSVEEVLADLLKGTDYGFKKIGKQYVIRKNQILNAEQPPVADDSPSQTVPKVTEEHKTDTVWNKTLDTVRIFDTLRIVATVMRHDTVVRVERIVETDTVYDVRYKGLSVNWPAFRDNGWFVSPSLTRSVVRIGYEDKVKADSSSLSLAPATAYAVGVEGGYKSDRLSFGMSLAYRSSNYRFSLEQLVFSGDYYVKDTLDTYYVVHPASGDTSFYHIVDSVYVPLETTRFSYRDVNRVDYLSVGIFSAFDFWKREHFRVFAKAGASLDFLLACSGSHNAVGQPFHAEIVPAQAKGVRISYHAGLGAAVKIANRIELVPEVMFRNTVGNVYQEDFPFELRMRHWDFRLGLTYYF